MIDFMTVWLFFICKRGFASSKNIENQQCIFYSLRNGLECEARRFMRLNTHAFLRFLHFSAPLLHIFSLSTLFIGYFYIFMQHVSNNVH